MFLEQPDIAAPAEDDDMRDRRIAARRAATMLVLETARGDAAEMIGRLNDGSACRLPEDQQELYNRLRDPYLALDRAVGAMIRIVAIEERLDEDAETRARRMEEAAEARAARAAEEQAARESAARREEAARAEAAEIEVVEAKKRAIRGALTNIHRETFPDMAEWELERLLDETLSDYLYEFDDDEIEAYADASAVIVAKLCESIGIMANPNAGLDNEDGAEGEDEDEDEEAEERPLTGKEARDLLVALAEESLAEMETETAANGNIPEAGIPPPARAQGPPG